MDVMPWQAVVFVSIPEAFLVNLMGFTLIRIKPDIKRLALVAVVQALCSYFIRGLPFVYGVHIILQIITTLVLVKIFIKYKWQVTVIGVLIGIAVFTGVIDTLYLPNVFKLVSLDVILKNTWLRVAVSIPEQLIMLAIIIVCKRFNLGILNMSAHKEGSMNA